MALIFRRGHPAENKIQAVYPLLSVAKKLVTRHRRAATPIRIALRTARSTFPQTSAAILPKTIGEIGVIGGSNALDPTPRLPRLCEKPFSQLLTNAIRIAICSNR